MIIFDIITILDHSLSIKQVFTISCSAWHLTLPSCFHLHLRPLAALKAHPLPCIWDRLQETQVSNLLPHQGASRPTWGHGESTE